MPRFTELPHDRRSPMLPRVAKIRLGVKKTSQRGREYPSEVDYFVLPDCPEVAKVYGDAPKSLPIVFPVEMPDVIMPHCYRRWGSDKGCICQGDGRNYYRSIRTADSEPYIEEGECPQPDQCEFAWTKADGSRSPHCLCIRQGTLNVMLPAVSMAGVYQIDTTSWHSIQTILDGLEYIRTACGRVSWLMVRNRPLIHLVRKPIETHGSGRKEIHWPMRLELQATPDEVMLIRRKALTGGSDDRRALPTLPEPSAPEDLLPQSHWRGAVQQAGSHDGIGTSQRAQALREEIERQKQNIFVPTETGPEQESLPPEENDGLPPEEPADMADPINQF